MRCGSLGQKRQVGSCPGCQPKIQLSVRVGAQAVIVSSTLRMATARAHTSSSMEWTTSHVLILSQLPWSTCCVIMTGTQSRSSKNSLGGEILPTATP